MSSLEIELELFFRYGCVRKWNFVDKIWIHTWQSLRRDASILRSFSPPLPEIIQFSLSQFITYFYNHLYLTVKCNKFGLQFVYGLRSKCEKLRSIHILLINFYEFLWIWILELCNFELFLAKTTLKQIIYLLLNISNADVIHVLRKALPKEWKNYSLWMWMRMGFAKINMVMSTLLYFDL